MRGRRALAALAAAVAAIGTVAAVGGSAGAAGGTRTVTNTFTSACPMTVPGFAERVDQIGKFSVDLDVPESAVAGRPTGPLPYRAVGSSDLDLGEGSPLRAAFAEAGATSVTASIKINLIYYSFVGGGEYHSLEFGADIPLSAGVITMAGSGELPPLAFPQAQPRSTVVWMGGYSVLLTPRRADGSTTSYGTLSAGCQIPPSFFPWVDLAVLPAAATHSAAATGRLARTPVDFGTGSLTLTQGDGSTTGALDLPSPATVTTKALGVLPTTATVRLSTGPLTGALPGPLSAQATVAIPDLSVVGIPLLRGSTTCRSTGPLTLTPGADFTLAGGGALTGTFDTPAFTGCGAFGGFVGALFAGKGNALTVTATPR